MFACVLVFSVIFSSVPLFAQAGSLEVTCEGPSGAPEKDVQITVIPINANKGSNKKTSAAGVAVFDKLNNGAYRVVGRKSGFAPALYELAIVNSDKFSVTLKLENGADRKLHFEDPVISRQADMLTDEGIKALEAGNLEETERILNQALTIKPSSPDALFYYGVTQARQGKFDQAQELLRKSADYANLLLPAMPKPKPGGPDTRAFYQQIAQNAEQQIALIPLMKAETAYGAKRYDEAVMLYDEIIRADPQNALIQSNKALALAQAGRTDEAVASIDRALELQPGNERIEQIKKVIDAFIENAVREKENALIKQANELITEGNKLLESNDASSALKKYEEANALTSEKQPMIWRQLGRALARLKQDTEAVAAFRKAIELAPSDQMESYQMALAQFYLDANRPDEALDIAVTGAKDPEQRLMDLFTRSKNNLETITLATAALERVIKLNPSNIEAVFELGQLYYMDKKDSQAQELLSRYVENGKDTNRVQTAKDFLTLIARRNKTD